MWIDLFLIKDKIGAARIEKILKISKVYDRFIVENNLNKKLNFKKRDE